MTAAKPPSLAEVFSVITDPRVKGRSSHKLVDAVLMSACAIPGEADNFVEIQVRAKARLGWLRGYMKLEPGTPSHDTLGRVFGVLDAQAVEKSFRQWVSGILQVLEAGSVVAADGKTSRPQRQ